MLIVDPTHDGDNIVLIIDKHHVGSIADECDGIGTRGRKHFLIGIEEPVHIAIAGVRAGHAEGLSPEGEWRLEVVDSEAQDTGTLRAWSLEIGL